MNSDLLKITQISEHLFLSGIYSLNHWILGKLNIKYIVACVDRNYIAGIHDKIILNNPDITILYIPYDDDIKQNLWMVNKNQINIIKYASSAEDYNNLVNLLKLYNNKPMIEIGYHFINMAVESKKNVLVHCIAGVSRSASLVIYFLMKKFHLDFEKALALVREKRSIINPNESFKFQLKSYQNKRDQFTHADAEGIISSIRL
ncbi:MAG: dual specificity protein phosphatase [Nitrososphaerota archaeon]